MKHRNDILMEFLKGTQQIIQYNNKLLIKFHREATTNNAHYHWLIIKHKSCSNILEQFHKILFYDYKEEDDNITEFRAMLHLKFTNFNIKSIFNMQIKINKYI